MTKSVTIITGEKDSTAAGEELGRGVRSGFGGAAADAVIVFASAQHDYQALLRSLAAVWGPEAWRRAVDGGECTHMRRGEGYGHGAAVGWQGLHVSIGGGRGLATDAVAAARQGVTTSAGLKARRTPYQSALVMTDALAGHTEAFVEELTVATNGNYRFFGGGAGDDGRFHMTHVFAGLEAVSDAAVALEMLSMEPIGVGVSHGWVPASAGFRVTEVQGNRLISLNGAPALEAFHDHAEATGQTLPLSAPLPFSLHTLPGI